MDFVKSGSYLRDVVALIFGKATGLSGSFFTGFGFTRGLMSKRVTAGLGVGVNGGNESKTDTFFASGFLGKGAGNGAVFLAGKAAFTGGLATVAALATGFTGADLTGTDFAGRDLTGTDGLAGAALATAFTGTAFFTGAAFTGAALAGAFFLATGAGLATGLAAFPDFCTGLAATTFLTGAAFFAGALVAFFAAFTGFEATFAFFLVAIYRN